MSQTAERVASGFVGAGAALVGVAVGGPAGGVGAVLIAVGVSGWRSTARLNREGSHE